MNKLLGMILLHVYVISCATSAPEPSEQATLQAGDSQEAVHPVIVQPAEPVVQGFVCRPITQKVSAKTVEALGFHISQLQIIEDGETAELIVERKSIVGDIPLRSLHFPSTRYNIDGRKRYGEWEKSEHWIRLRKTPSGYRGRFVFESEFLFPIACD